MKKIVTGIVLLTSIMHATPLGAMQCLYNCIKNYFSHQQQPLDLPQPITSSHIFEEFAFQRDKENNIHTVFDIKLFNKNYQYFKHLVDQYENLQKCAVQEQRWPTIRKDYALLKYGNTMIQCEKEWKSWHTELVKKEGKKDLQLHYYTAPITRTTNAKPEYIRQDIKSPYYKNLSFTEEVRKDEKRRDELYQLNALENAAYHDELKFLQKQLHKMELYWNMKPTVLKIWHSIWLCKLQYDEYKKQHDTLETHIKWFKTEEARHSFTQSCMKRKEFTDIRSMRQGI